MSFKIGIVGLPNVGKSTLFQALTRKKVDISNYPFCTIDPNVGVVEVPDERLKALAGLVPGAKVLPAVIEVVDVAGLIKGAHKGLGLGNQFLSYLFPMDALLFLIRCFEDPNIVSMVVDPKEQYEILLEELRIKDEEISQRTSPKSSHQTMQISSDRLESASFQKLSEKPLLIVCNIKSGTSDKCEFNKCALTLDAELERQIAEMTEDEIKELGITSKLPELIQAAYQTLDLITFYTLKGGKELRAWSLKRGSTAPEAGGVIHTDFKEKFIRAEVIQWDQLVEAKSWQKSKELGWIRTEGKEYMVQDGDVIEFKI